MDHQEALRSCVVKVTLDISVTRLPGHALCPETHLSLNFPQLWIRYRLLKSFHSPFFLGKNFFRHKDASLIIAHKSLPSKCLHDTHALCVFYSTQNTWLADISVNHLKWSF